MLNDAHCHFFSTNFFSALGRGLPGPPEIAPAQAAGRAIDKLGWEAPASPAQLADRWAAELDRHGVSHAALIASIPGDSESVAAALRRHPQRFVGFFMADPTQADADAAAAQAIDR